jgi:hypothetical protein
MEVTQYKIIFNGAIVPPHDVERVKNNLAALFGTSASALDSLFQDRLVVIKKGLNLEEADRYREAVERVGGYCIIERMDEPAQASVVNLNTRVEKMVCPKCHSLQPKKPVCSSCGVIVEEFRKRIAEDRDAVIAILESESGNIPATSIQGPAQGAPAVANPGSLDVANPGSLDVDSERSTAPPSNQDQ